MTHPFAGIDEKLKRSREHVLNLQVEIDRFFEECGYAVLPQNDMQLLLKACHALEQQIVPLRFSIIVGEIVHHLRSCLDHIVWQFSSPTYRSSKDARFIEFPILESRPRNENRSTSYERKVKGINNSAVLDVIERLQPYNSPDPAVHLLLAIHNMDITDKHRELVLCVSSGAIAIPPDAARDAFMGYQDGVLTETQAQAHMKNYAQFVPTVAFRDFGQGNPQPVLPLLEQLHNCVVTIVATFAEHLPCEP